MPDPSSAHGTVVAGRLSVGMASVDANSGRCQGVGVIAATAFAFTATYAIAWALRATMGLRVTPDEESEGLDSSQHAETAYEFTATSSLGRVS
jgi:ammonia channel protein AmtB